MIRSFSRILTVGVALVSIVFPSMAVFAHPLDVSSTSLTIRSSQVSGVTFLHPAEVERILGLRGIAIRSITYADYYKHSDYIFDYLRAHIELRSAGQRCSVDHFATRDRGVDEIYSEWFPVTYDAQCPTEIRELLDVRITIFVDLPLQTNRVKLFDAEGNPLGYKVLTSSIREYVFDLSGASVQAVDTDRDGLSDEEERAYRTDPNRVDTDRDNYSDAEEVNNGWNPLSHDLSPGQKYREEPLAVTNTGSISAGQDEISRRYMRDTGLLDASGYGGGYLRQTLSAIVAFMGEGNLWSLPSLFVLVVFLGFIHAAWPGHSKSLLAAFVLDRRNGWRHGMMFALIFTVTHLADITLLVLVTKYLFSVYDPTPYMTLLQQGGAVLLVGFSGFIIVRALWKLWRSPHPTPLPGGEGITSSPPRPLGEGMGVRACGIDVRNPSLLTPSNIFLGFFAGLAPCTFGWSIFLVLFSLGRMEWALPLLGALGIGIFLCLALVVVIVTVTRERILARIPRFTTYSEILSAASIGLVAIVVVSAVF